MTESTHSGDSAEQPRGGAGLRRMLGLVPAVLLVLVAGWEIAVATHAGDNMPDDKAWQAAAEAVRQAHQPGELIVFAPEWIDPVGRLHLGDLIPIDMAARMDDARYPVVWELSVRGARAAESRGRQLEWYSDFGGLEVRRLVGEPVQVGFDFVAQFGRARVAGAVAGRPLVRLEEVGYAPRRCIRVEPRPDQTVRITYRDVTLGRELVGHVGLADVFTRHNIRDPGRLQLSVDGSELAAVEFGVDDGWVRFAATTEPTRSAEVTFALTAVGARARQRLICFAAEARQ